MSAHPEQVAQLEALVAKHKALVKELMGILETLSRGTAEDVLTGPCRKCGGRGTVWVDHFGRPSESAPCSCPAGLPFRNAAAMQARKREAQAEASADLIRAMATPRHLAHGEKHAKGEAGRDKQWRDE